MRAYDPNRSMDVKYGRDSSMEGSGAENLTDRFSRLGLRGGSGETGGSANGNSIYQIMQAVEDADYTIRQQLEENEQLREELQRKTKELEKYKSNAEKSLKSRNVNTGDEQTGSQKAYVSSVETRTNEVPHLGNSLLVDPSIALVIHQNGALDNEVIGLQGSEGSHLFSESHIEDRSGRVFENGHANTCSPRVAQYSLQSSRSVSPSGHHKEGEYDDRLASSSSGQIHASEINRTNNPWKQELILKVRRHEEEISQLKRHLADFSVKEAHICQEKYVLEKRIAHMRMAFDQQQQDLVDAASKALSCRQEIIEENIRLTYELQSAQQERSTYVSSLLPLLSEYNLQPSVPDALSVVSNLKLLFRHLHEKLIVTEEKLKESQYQLTPWHVEVPNASSFAPQSPSNYYGAAQSTPYKHGLEIVPQQPYSHVLSPIASPSNVLIRTDWESRVHQTSSGGYFPKSPNYYNMGNASPSVDRNFMSEDIPTRAAVTQDDSHAIHFTTDSKEKSPLLKDVSRGNEMDESEATGPEHTRDSSMQWGSSTPFLGSRLEDPNVPYPYLPPVLEEPTSSFSEAADDDPLPAIEGLQFSGEAYPGRELLACGYSTNGTTSCNFEWVRCLEDGSVNYIEHAKQPAYLVTADDVDCYLAIDVQPLDNRNRKGELVRVFANDQRKIACDPEMQREIERILSVGEMSFQVSISAGALSIWENAMLAIKMEGYSIKCNGPRGVVVTEKFSKNTEILIPHGQPFEFTIETSGGVDHLLQSSSSSLRDTIVLTLRLFKMRAVEKRKGRRKGLFFK